MLLPFQGDIVYTIQHQGNQIYNATTINGSQKIYTNAVTQFNDNQTITIMHFTTTDYTIFTYLVLLLEIVLVFRWYSLNYEWGEKAKLTAKTSQGLDQ
ncbi:MAG: hypothetical protein KGJ07_00630 [Patescibacteria group bacterium]|nr:hypothetical protein [Patescibacteria group bacterium]